MSQDPKPGEITTSPPIHCKGVSLDVPVDVAARAMLVRLQPLAASQAVLGGARADLLQLAILLFARAGTPIQEARPHAMRWMNHDQGPAGLSKSGARALLLEQESFDTCCLLGGAEFVFGIRAALALNDEEVN